MWNDDNYVVVWTFFGIALRWDWNENWPFQSCGHCWVFQICWHFECSTLTATSFRIWNRSAGIPSIPLALFIAMLPKAHLTSHSRISGSSWVITPLWLSGSWKSLCIVLLLLGPYHFCPLSSPSLHEMFPPVQFSCSVMSDSLRPHESHHTRLPWPSPSPGVC